MMRELWVRTGNEITPEAGQDMLKAASEAGATVVLDGASSEAAKALGLRIASSKDGDILVVDEAHWEDVSTLKADGKTICAKVIIHSGADEEKALEAVEAGFDYILVSCPDWKVIPLENLISRVRGRAKLLAEVMNSQEARTALETLELGVDGVCLIPSSIVDVVETKRVLDDYAQETKLELVSAKVVGTRPLGLGHRVCIDTCDIMGPGEGMLLGCQSSGLVLVHAEVQENPHVEARPFRVNAGPIALYILTTGSRTRYLSELKAGDVVQVVDREGRSRPVVVGRIKIERRPLMLVETEVKGWTVTTIAQNAETIRFVTENGSKAVTELKEGDKVLVHHQLGGRHFGALVSEESVIER
jgi:3-dehydroquinate synthase II